jgi:hypothetical protein
VAETFVSRSDVDLARIAARVASESVKITDPDAMEKIAQLEGPGWINLQSGKWGDEELGFNYALKRWQEIVAETDPEWDAPEDIASGCTIYGNGGVHRYYVNRAGDLLFSKHHSNAQFVEKARALGFKIH